MKCISFVAEKSEVADRLCCVVVCLGKMTMFSLVPKLMVQMNARDRLPTSGFGISIERQAGFTSV